MNVGYVEASADGFECFLFHDVDMIADDDSCPYNCQRGPAHLGFLLDKYNYKPDFNVGKKVIGKLSSSSWKFKNRKLQHKIHIL